MTFAEPSWLGFSLLLPLLGLLWWGMARLHQRKLARLFTGEMFERILPRSVRIRRAARDLLVLAALLLSLIALAEPRFDKSVRSINAKGTDLVLLLDLSRSMDARDVDPSRLERARREIADLGEVIEGDRIGLVMFAGGAYPRLPLTSDFRAVELVVSEASTDSFDTQGSNLAAALRVGRELLERSRQEAGQVMLVLSDGETHHPDEALAEAGLTAEAGIPVFVLGIGLEPSPIPTRDGGFLEWQGSVVTTNPDFEILKSVARATGGAFVSSTASKSDIEQIYTEIRRSVTAVERSSQRRETWRTAFQWPLGAASLLLLLAGWLGEGRRAFGAALVLLLLGATPAAHAADLLLEADNLYREQKYTAAAEKLVELSLQYPDDPQIFERLGAARYRASDFEGAARAFDAAAELRGASGTDDVFNSGNALYRSGRLEDAQQRYEKVLEKQPEHEGAKHNRDLLLREIEARRAQKPPPPPKPGEGDKPPQSPQGKGEKAPQPQQGDQKEQGEGQSQPQQEGAEGEPVSPNEGGGQPGQGMQEQKQGDPKGQGGQSDEPMEPGSSGAVDPGEVQDAKNPDPNAPAGGAGSSAGEDKGPITSSQAHRLLDSIEEGNQRVVVQGRAEGKPW